MKPVNGHELGVWSLRLDATSCTLLGAAVALAAAPIADVVSLPQPLITAAGIAVVVWAGLVWWMLMRLPIQTALRVVMGANVVAAGDHVRSYTNTVASMPSPTRTRTAPAAVVSRCTMRARRASARVEPSAIATNTSHPSTMVNIHAP